MIFVQAGGTGLFDFSLFDPSYCPVFFQGGFWHASLIDKHLVDVYVPFLPLEYKHVIKCGLAEMAAKGIWPDLDVAEKMANDYIYFPKDKDLFSTQGCKLIAQRLNFYL